MNGIQQHARPIANHGAPAQPADEGDKERRRLTVADKAQAQQQLRTVNGENGAVKTRSSANPLPVEKIPNPFETHDASKFTASDPRPGGGSDKIELDVENRPFAGSADTWGSGSELTVVRPSLALAGRSMGQSVKWDKLNSSAVAGSAVQRAG